MDHIIWVIVISSIKKDNERELWPHVNLFPLKHKQKCWVLISDHKMRQTTAGAL